MRSVTAVSGGVAPVVAKPPSLLRRMWRYKWLYLLALPGFAYFLVFKIVPMWGLVLAFMDYNPYAKLWDSEWLGWKNFEELFAGDKFFIMLRNTLAINILALIFMFPVPILLALMLNEVRHGVFKRLNQSIVYLPHFLSWVVVASLTFFLLSADIGVVNKILVSLGYESKTFLTNPDYFWFIITVQNIWKEAGWGTIIFLAALAGVDPQLYEAAVMDGASRFRQIWHITLPAIRSTIIVLLILRLGNMADVGFEQILLMMNPLVISVAEVFDTYAYNVGILRGQITFGVAVGMFKGVVGLVLVLVSNYIVKKMGHDGIY